MPAPAIASRWMTPMLLRTSPLSTFTRSRSSPRCSSDTTLAEARREAEGSNVHLLDGDEVVIDGVRFLGATLWTDFELAIETPEGLVSDAARAMKMTTNLLNDYALSRTVDEAAEPDTWRDKQGRKLQAADTLRIHQAQRAWLRDRVIDVKSFAGETAAEVVQP